MMTLLEDYWTALTQLSFLGILFVLVALALVLIAAGRLGLKIAGEASIAVVRGLVQLGVVALILVAVVQAGHWGLIAALLLVMVIAAGWTAAARTKRPGIFPTTTIVIALVTAALVAPLLYLGPFETRPLFLIPITGMVLGNAMNATALGLDRMRRELQLNLPLIEARLALGATDTIAVRAPLRETVRTAMMPTLNTLKTTGLVHLPGMMTGMLIAGATPVEAAEMQFVIIVVILISAFLASTTMAIWLRKRFLDDQQAGRLEAWRADEGDEA
jgi:putative ABC transport system permease protein